MSNQQPPDEQTSGLCPATTPAPPAAPPTTPTAATGKAAALGAARADRRRYYRTYNRIELRPPHHTDITGTARRLQALTALGWPTHHLTQALECAPRRVHDTRGARNPHVTTTFAHAVTRLYDQLSMTPGPDPRAARYAARRGWHPPLAWDDDQLDDPHAIPNGVGLRHDQQLENDVARLAAAGWGDGQIARHLGRNRKVIWKVRHRLARRAHDEQRDEDAA